MKRLEYVPNGLAAINEFYGNPDKDADGNLDHGWHGENVIPFPLPFAMRLSWDPMTTVTRARMHYKIGDVVVDALNALEQEVPGRHLRACNCDLFGGVFNFRANRRANRLSTHSWAIAIDINPHLGPIGEPSMQPDFIREAFTSRGFQTFDDDGMHFQACGGW